MATPLDQLDQLISTTYDKYRKTLSDNVTQHVPLLNYLDGKASVKERGGLTIRVPLMVGLNDTVGSYSGYDLLDTTPQGGIAYAEFQWRQFAGAVTISGEEILKNAGVEQIIDLLDAKFTQLRRSFQNWLNEGFWASTPGNGGKDMLGIPAIVDDTSVLGGVDPADAAWWKSLVVDASALGAGATAWNIDDAQDGISLLTETYNSLTIDGSNPDLEITSQVQFEKFENNAVDKIRYADRAMVREDFDSLRHRKATVIFDHDAPADEWYFLNSANLQFVKHADAWLTRTEFMRPVDQDAKTAQVLSMGQLITNERRAHGKITGLDTA